MSKQSVEKLRQQYVQVIIKALEGLGEEVLRTNSNEVAIPCVDSEGNEQFCVFTVKIPTGSRDGEVYDGYSMAEDYTMKVAAKEEKTKEAAAKKAKKAERDAKAREARAAAKAAHTNEKPTLKI